MRIILETIDPNTGDVIAEPVGSAGEHCTPQKMRGVMRMMARDLWHRQHKLGHTFREIPDPEGRFCLADYLTGDCLVLEEV